MFWVSLCLVLFPRMGLSKISAKPFSRSYAILCIWVPLAPGIRELVRASPETFLLFILGLPLEDPQNRSQRTKERLHLKIQFIYTDNPEEGAGHGETRFSLSYRKRGKKPARLLSGWQHSRPKQSLDFGLESSLTTWFQSSEATWLEERSNSCKLTSDLHACSSASINAHKHTHK